MTRSATSGSRRSEMQTTIFEAFSHAGPDLATVYLPSLSATDDAAASYQRYARLARKQLADLGATESMLDTVTAALQARDHSEGEAVVLVASDHEVIFNEVMIRPIDDIHVALAPTPQLLPLLAATRVDKAHVAVLLDRVGAEIWQRDGLGAPVNELTVDGDEEHIHRGHFSGWSQRRFQQVAENTWESNAKEVVEALTDTFPDSALVIAGGDVRAVGFFADHLPSRFQPLVLVEGSRAAGPESFLDQVDVAVRTEAAQELAADLHQLREAVGRNEACTGQEALQLLGQGRIDTVYVANDTFDPDRALARFQFSVPLVADPNPPSGSDSVEVGTDGPRTAPAAEGAVTLAVATGATVVVVPSAAVAPLGGPVLATLRGGGAPPSGLDGTR